MDLPDRINNQQTSCFPVPGSCWPDPIPKSGPVHATHPAGLSDGMSDRHKFFCDSLPPSLSTATTESNKA
jgi:hypothetical protein